MRKYGDFHVHTRFCDGRESIEEMAAAAFKMGMYAIGFSSHSPMPFECGWCLKENWIEEYKTEIDRVRTMYEDRMEVLAGLELDLFSELPLEGLDYIICSAHFVKKDSVYLPVDESGERLQADVNAYYNGDIFAYICDFYEEVSHLADRGPAVIGHYDLVTKFNEGGKLFDESDPRYLTPAMEALEVLVPKGAVFEINTGAIFRGYRSRPYPSIPLLRRMQELGGRFILSGDCHCYEALCYQFDQAAAYAERAGVTKFEKYPPARQ